ncbi:aminopeptidase P family protein [Elizabethkingia meningoseptica]|uniref:aminopeptidase P family protein n=1 Tax=Elizabethkingia meningoseptica TaxID=238 RepID=UPI0023AFE770|nr:aminopeptidase P family protein [Elizabethkingia meningoseptica]MDE5437271.1 aminopeptidase P family protein [Elizabethkingia meningoseptica]MDE5510373.1 aminopeptidase P family protein [Elizabethkingia meningoseptica]MDE5514220.1 aminopeptidase P family protein [Elizabethkingia meningoseptica]MDE5524867.1 aminopeptidase P family protein [Elizabethkingia meningoseptica]MDE5528431.1 aminopeptidase P family protein [Elizabethkingia meningoseptica]
MTSKEKIAALRDAMHRNNIDAFIVYSADPHMSEYLPKEWQERSWLSGFTGSAGFVVITKDKGGLWTDGRYFTQAPIELEGSGIDLFKDGVEGTSNYIDWIISEIPAGGKVAVNALATAHSNWEALDAKFKAKDITLTDLPLLKEIWTDRGTAAKNPIYVHPVDRAGQSVSGKIAAIRQKMEDQNADTHIISSLDDVAWTLNLRGSDVQSNPVFLGYIVLSKNDAVLFTDLEKLDTDARRQMDESGVKMMPYDEFFNHLQQVKHQTILISPNSNQSIFDTLKENNTFIKAAVPGNLMKAQKNKAELEGFRTVMVRDGVAMVKFLYWLTHQAGKEAMNEYSIGEKLRGFRAEGANFVGESFGSIIGYRGNGAIIHYSAKAEGSKEVTNDGSILVDSGGQYLEGTTDITRTLALGAVTEEFKKDSTLVLQGMIRLSMVKFPKGTRGVQLDALARLPLWMEGKDYNHGTGHGVGSFMNVHEGPQNIRKDLNPQELLPGMVLSNEPGYYVVNQYGIRHENLIAVREAEKTEWNTFYEFETLTLCPFFKDIIVKEILSADEIQWLNTYHKTCEEKLGPHLEGDVKNWFLGLVSPL